MKLGKQQWIFIFAIGVVVLFAAAHNQRSTEPEQVKTPKEKAHQEMAKPKAARHNWAYFQLTDTMTGSLIKYGVIESTNTVSFNFPYAGEQKGTLTLRNHPRYGNDVMLQIERGQFLTGVDGCEVLIRFDDGKPQTFWANGPADHSSTTLFIRGYSKLVAALKKSQIVFIEAPFFQSGNRVFQFRVDGLDWEISPPKKKGGRT